MIFKGVVNEGGVEAASTLFVGGSGVGNYSNIQEAIDNASSGDTIFVYDDNSPYYKSSDYMCLFIWKKINLVGENKETTIIDGEEEDNVVCIGADGVSVSGFTIQNSEKNAYWETFAGINLGNVEDCNIFNNNIINNYIGIKIDDKSENNMIRDNNIFDNQVGVSLSGSSENNLVKNNNISSNEEQGIQIWSSDSNQVENNAISNNKVGIETSYSKYNKISSNQVFTNEYGIWLTRSSYANEIIKNNVTSNSNTGLRILDSVDNIIYYNNFINNQEQAYDRDNDNIWNNEDYEGNYWSDYQGIDNGAGGRKKGDNVGDTILPHLGLDNYPLINPPGSTPIPNNSSNNHLPDSESPDDSNNYSIILGSSLILAIIIVAAILIIVYLKKFRYI
jgi:parallel beta-helix repeat protein